MKKVGLLVIGLCACFMLFTGCGKKSLRCEINMDSYMNGMGHMKGIYDIGFDKDGYASDIEIVMEAEITSADINDSDMATLKAYLNSMCESGQVGFDSCDVSVKGKTVTMVATGSAKSVTKSNSKTEEEAKEYFEKIGFTCK